MSSSRGDHLQVTVFRDQDSARSWNVPLAWINRFALLGLALVLLCVVLTLVALREYGAARRYDPSRVVDLERKVMELGSALQHAQLEMTESAADSRTQKLEEAEAPAPAVFGPLPLNSKDALPYFAVENLSIKNENAQTQIRMDLRYAKADGGSKSGTLLWIVQLQNGSILTYPENVWSMQSAGQVQLDPKKGERFSVSKMRESKATFTPALTRAALKQVQIWIFENKGADPALIQKESIDVNRF